jgi:hypothetical protein
MKVLMLAVHDWANTGYRFLKCLRLLGYNVTAFKAMSHKFNYPDQIKIHGGLKHKEYKVKPWISMVAPELKQFVQEAEVVHFIATTFIDTGEDLTQKKVVINYGGSTYRRNPYVVSKFFNNFVDCSLIQCPDLLNLGAKNEHLIYYPVDTDFIQPVFNQIGSKLLVGHFPSNSEVKGTKTVLDVVKNNKNIEYVGKKSRNKRKKERINWLDNLKRMSQCDVYIETIQPVLEGKKFGEWGNTALEAASLGKIVITNTLTKDLYNKEYGKLPLLIANNKKQLKKRLNYLSSLTEGEILNLKRKTRQWAEDKHSISATAKRLYEKIYKYFE